MLINLLVPTLSIEILYVYRNDLNEHFGLGGVYRKIDEVIFSNNISIYNLNFV